MRRIGTLIVVFLLLGCGPQYYLVGPSDGQNRYSTNFGFYWNMSGYYNYILLNRTTDTKQVVIEPVGAPFRANLTFKCPESFICPVKKINNIEMSPGKRVVVNYTFTAILKEGTLLDTQIIADLWNETASVSYEAQIIVRVVFPVSLECLGNYAREFSYWGKGTSYYMSYNWKNSNIHTQVKITNYDTKDTLRGFVGLKAVNSGESMPNPERYTIFNSTVVILPPHESTTRDIEIPMSSSKFWTFTQVYFMFSPKKNEANASSQWYFDNTLEPTQWEIHDIYIDYVIYGGVALIIDNPSNEFPAFGDIWNGTNISVTVFNGKTTPLRGFAVDVLDDLSSDMSDS